MALIQVKFSGVTNAPASLNVAEPAYSNVSNTLWIDDGRGVVPIGGTAYTSKIDTAASAATANVLVIRDTTGNAAFNYITSNVIGNATSSDKWFTPRNIGVSGDASGIISVDGTANANIPLILTDTAVTPGNYGGSTNAAVFTVDSKGRLTHAANIAISTTLYYSGDDNDANGSLSLIGDFLRIKGGPSGGINTIAVDANNTILVAVDNTVVRTSGNQSIAGDLSLTGSLFVAGNTTIVNTTTVSTADSLIKLAANNTVSDILDIGFYGVANTGLANTHHGLIRRAAGDFFLFKNLTSDPTSNVLSAGSVTAANTATVHANLTGGMIFALANTISVVDGGTGVGTFSVGSILVGDGTNSLKVLANTGTAGAYGSASNTLIITTDAYGRISAITNSAISLDISSINSGVLGVSRGGTNNDTYTTGAAVFYDGTAIKTLANTGTAGVFANASHVPVITTDAYGRVSGVTNTAIAIDADAVTSGKLAILRGGTNNDTYTTGAAVFYDGTSIKTLANTGTAGVYANASHIPVITTDALGRISNITNTAIVIDTSAVTTGTFGVVRGGTGNSSFAIKGVIISDPSSTTGALSALTSATEGHILQIVSGVPTFGHLNGGSF